MAMNTYKAKHGPSVWFIEAESYGDAIQVWHHFVKLQWGEEYAETDQPDMIELVNSRGVIRQEDMCKQIQPPKYIEVKPKQV